MPLDIDIDLRLDERSDAKVALTVLLAPTRGPARVEGVALQVFLGDEPVGPRTLLPIAGTLAAPMLTSIELGAHGDEPIPAGARVVATAWSGTDQREVIVPTDPGTAFEAHVRGLGPLGDPRVDPARELEPLEGDERRRFTAHFPWMDLPRIPRGVKGQLEVVDAVPTPRETAADAADAFGLDDETASWLNDLLHED